MLTTFMVFIALRMPFFMGGASSTAFFIAFAMMKGEREIEGYGHELKNQLEPQQKKELSRLSQDPTPKPIARTLHIPPSHMTSYRQIRWAYTAGSAYTSPSSTAKIQLHLLTYAQQRCGHDHTPEPGPCNNHSVSAHFMAFIAFIAFAFTLTTFMAFIAFIGGASTTAFFIAFAMMKGEKDFEGYGQRT